MLINTLWRFSTFFLRYQGRPTCQRSLESEGAYTWPGWLGTVVAPSGFPKVALRRFMTGFPNYWHNCQLSHWMMIAAAVFKDLQQNTPWSERFFTGLPWSLPGFDQNVIEEGVSCAMHSVHLYKEKVPNRKNHNMVSKMSVVVGRDWLKKPSHGKNTFSFFR